MTVDFENYRIEPIQNTDGWKLCDFITANYDRLKRYFPRTLEQNLTPDLSKHFVEKQVTQFRAKEEFLFKLKEKEHRTIIGLVYIKEPDWDEKLAELAYCIGYPYEGKGWMTQAVNTISKYALGELKLTTLKIIAHKSNTASIKVAVKCGYIWQRTLPKEHTPPNEEPLDMELYELFG